MTPEIEKRIKLVKAGKVPAGYKKTRIGVVPEEWRIGDLSEVLELTLREVEKPSKPYWRVGVRSWAKGTFRAYVDDPSSVDMDTLYQVKENDLVVSITFAWEHAIALATKEDDGLLVSHRFPTYVFKKNHLPIFYQKFVSQPIFKYMLELVSPGGAGRNRVLDKKNFIKLPCPILKFKEQEKIAEILAAQNQVIELKEKLIAGKQKQKKILVRYLLSTEQKTRRQFALGNIKINKGKWNRVQLNSLLEFKNGVNVDKDKFGSGVKMISVMDILSGKPINYDSIRGSVELSQEELSVYAVDYGDILFQRSSENYEDAGSSNVYIDKNRRATFSGFVIRGKKISEYEPYCLNAILRIPEVRRSIMRKAAGAQHVNIGQEALASIQINLPSLPEQQAIAKVLSVADEEISLLQKDLEQEKLKKKSLMQLLLTGLVRVSV